MISSLMRKAGQVAEDPVLRRWLARRLIGRERGPPAQAPGRPPYLAEVAPPATAAPSWTGSSHADRFAPPAAPIRIALAGESVELTPDDPGALFTRAYADLETFLSAHRFAWVPLAGKAVDADWVAALWRVWAGRHAGRRDGWPWHAYTAAERAINIIDFSDRHGLPGNPPDTLSLLAAHADAIAGNLEYYGEHYTSNHLSNNGRGLLRIGCACGLADVAGLGARIMIAEAGRIFGRSGVLLEGSSHYHLLLTRNYVDAWRAAAAAGMPEAATLRDIAKRALGVIPALRLPAGLPLIGDISPDCPPAFLVGLGDPAAAAQGGWPDVLPDEARTRIAALLTDAPAVSPDRVSEDGWHRFGQQGWSALTYVPPDGWPPMPGHGHQDIGGFELHWKDCAVLIDPGRGSYRDGPSERRYVSAQVHNSLTVDGHDPAPVNRPYYSDAFRRRILGDRPTVARTRAGLSLTHHGYGRLRGGGPASREWRFAPDHVEIVDLLQGRGRHTVQRRFCTAHPVETAGETADIAAGDHRFRLSAGAPIRRQDIICWTAYGVGIPGSLLICEEEAAFPCERQVRIERL